MKSKRFTAGLTAALVPVFVAGVVADAAQAQLSPTPGPMKTYDGDPGALGDPASWRTPEFLRDNGMLSIAAEYAYAAGFAGQGTSIGVVDSGTFAGHIREHGSKDTNYAVGDRYFGVIAQGGHDRADVRLLQPAVQRQPRHARLRHDRREP